MADPSAIKGPPGPALAGARVREVRLAAIAAAPRQAREAVRDHLDGVERETLDNVLLVTTELVTNAILHAQGPIDVRVEINDDAVVVRVFDCESEHPTVRPLDIERTDGRGLALVAMVSREWGSQTHDDGKTVWAVLDRERV